MLTLQLQLPLSRGSPRDAPGGAARLREAPEESWPEEDCPFDVPPPAAAPERFPPRPLLVARAQAFAGALSAQLERPVRLFVTDNRSTMLSFRRREELLVLRVHHMFLMAPDAVVRAVGDYAGRGRRVAGPIIDAFVRTRGSDIRADADLRSSPTLKARGGVFDLQAIFDRVNERFFKGAIEARIGWGRGSPGRRRRTIRMGVYDHLTRTIRVHPALDRAEVPAFFVEYIVFHEMLHQAIPGREGGRRRQHHGADFRAQERAYPDYARALAWERDHLGMLLGRAVRADAGR